jgi:hypothetical protein
MRGNAVETLFHFALIAKSLIEPAAAHLAYFGAGNAPANTPSSLFTAAAM